MRTFLPHALRTALATAVLVVGPARTGFAQAPADSLRADSVRRGGFAIRLYAAPPRLDLPEPAPAQADDVPAVPDSTPPKRVGRAVAQAMLANVVVNRAGSLMSAELKGDMAATPATWRRNLRLGWVWDEEGFVVNMIGHPVQGALYFNAGRANGLSYWESAPLVVLGSWTWEYLGESLRPSLNDFFTTTLSGIAVGEMAHRFAAVVRDERARGLPRHAREAAALVLDPVGGANRALRGQWARVGENPPEHSPGAVYVAVETGLRHVVQDETGAVDGGYDPGILLDLGYGDTFERPFRLPFDVFTARLQFTTGRSGNGLETVQTTGRLYQIPLSGARKRSVRGQKLQTALVVNQRFDYVYTPPFSFGGQSVDVGVAARLPLGGAFRLNASALASTYVFGAISAPGMPRSSAGAALPDTSQTYDYGPAVGTVVGVALTHRGVPVAWLTSRTAALHVVSGTPADHFLSLTDLKATLPVGRGWGVGVNLNHDARTTRFADASRRGRAFTQARLYVSWTSARRAAASAR